MSQPPTERETVNEELSGEEADELDIDVENLESNEEADGESTVRSMVTGESTHVPRLDADSKKRLLLEYRDVVKSIDEQNKTINTLKSAIVEKGLKSCKTRSDEKELRNLRCTLEREHIKLQCLLKKAISLQAEDPHKAWGNIPLATTFDEDNMCFSYPSPKKSTCDHQSSDNSCPSTRRGGVKNDSPCDKQTSFLCNLINQIKCGKEIDKSTLKKLGQILKSKNKREHDCHHERERFSKELHRSYSMQDRLATDNAELEGDRYRLQEEVLGRDKNIDCLQQKINLLQKELQLLCYDKQKMMDKSQRPCSPPRKHFEENSKVKYLEENIGNMESCMEKLKVEIDCLRKERVQCENTVKKDICSCTHNHGDTFESVSDHSCRKTKTKSAEVEELKNNYSYLLGEYAKKDVELKEMKERAGSYCDKASQLNKQDNRNVDSPELLILREKVSDLQEEQEEFKCLIKEQAEQIIEYQNKYLAAQQKVEEQKCLLNKLEMSNKKIEDQINLEIQRIKEKFQDKLKELAQLPNLLENEQLKLAASCKEKENLEAKLRLVCKELKSMKLQTDNKQTVPDCSQKVVQLEGDLAVMQKEYEDMKRDKDLLSEKLGKTKEDLDTLRTESAKIITKTKERAVQTRSALQERIDRVEKELAHCRATACLSISDREEAIKEMQCQLNTIAYSFDSAQKQIKTLKNHIAFLSQEEICAVKC